ADRLLGAWLGYSGRPGRDAAAQRRGCQRPDAVHVHSAAGHCGCGTGQGIRCDLGRPGQRRPGRELEAAAQGREADLRRGECGRLAGRLQFRSQRLGADRLPALSGRSGYRRPCSRVSDPALVLQDLVPGGTMATVKVDYEAKREALKKAYLKPKSKRPATSARGIHHLALISGDSERTIKFYSEVLGFPLVEMFENRDLKSSTHFFHDLGHGNLLAFFDFPEDPMPPTRESVGGMHHVSIS